MMELIPETARILVALVVMLWLPGQTLIMVSRTGSVWPGLQQPVVAVGLSIACYPVLFYGLRWVALPISWLPLISWLGFAGCALWLGWAQRQRRTGQKWSTLEWIALGVIGLTLFTRFWIPTQWAYPAWSDSLHHVLLTQLTHDQGRLPHSLDPYFPVSVDMYHLGLYALSATLQWLAQVPAHTALFWMAQALNGLGGLGVYLLLARCVGQVGGLIGLLVVGIFSFQPAFYVNWGRFTQVASQALLLIAWVMTLVTLQAFARSAVEPTTSSRSQRFAFVCFSALLTAGVFLLHFRVAAFYLPALALVLLAAFWRYRSPGQWRALLIGTISIGLLSLLLIIPTLWAAIRTYLATLNFTADVAASDPATRAQSVQAYYAFPWDSFFTLGAPSWLWLLAGGATLIGLWRRQPLTLFALVWMILLVLEGLTYLTGISWLMFTNLGAILILLYLPLGLLIGVGAQQLIQQWPSLQHGWLARGLLGGLLLVSLPSASQRMQEIEPYRFFVTDADVQAMAWINANLPEDAQFAVNTEFWLPNVPHGTDAGYWLPYFTNRTTTAGVMIMGGEYLRQVAAWSTAAEALEEDLTAVQNLRAAGVDYIYIGARGDFAGPGLQLEQLRQSPELTLLYEHDGVAILQINP